MNRHRKEQAGNAVTAGNSKKKVHLANADRRRKLLADLSTDILIHTRAALNRMSLIMNLTPREKSAA